ncbi:hypothetical protein ACFFHI_24080, partial [Streptomyces palmae]
MQRRYRSSSSGWRARASRLATAALALVVSAGVTALGPVGTASAQPTAVGSPLVSETFTEATAPEFTGLGDACLTGAPPTTGPLPPGDHPLGGCPPGVGPVPPSNGAPHGYLRLTDATNDSEGAALYNHPVPANEGLNVTFDQWQYGSTTPATPADGISFFLVNGDTSLTRPGAFGGSLGYAQKRDSDIATNPILPGVDNGYLGVGLDVLGNYFGDWEQRGHGCAVRSPAGTSFHVPAPGPDMVTLRGPGNGIDGYCFMTATTNNFTTTGPWPSTLPGQLQGPTTSLPPGATPAEAEAALEVSRRRVHVQITPAPNPVVNVWIDFNDGTGSHQVLSTPAPTPVPPTYKFGFAASTGLFTDVHLIRNVVVTSDEPLPELNLVKQVVKPLPGDLTVGSRVPYEFVVTNSGETRIDNLAVNDPKIGPVNCPTTSLASGQTVTCTATYTVTAADVAAGRIANTAIATGTSDGETVESPPSSETVPVEQPPGIDVEKRVETPGPYSVGQRVTYTYTVRNIGGTQLTGVQVRDDHVTGITCESTTLAPVGEPGDSTTCTGTYTLTAADGTAGSVTNIATATGTSDGRTITSPEAQATIPVGAPHLTLTKRVASPGPFQVGDTVDYTYTLTDTGTTTLNRIVVQDDRVADVSCQMTTLTPGASTTCTGQYTITRADLDACEETGMDPCEITNIAQAGGIDAVTGNDVTSERDQATVQVRADQRADLTLVKRVTSTGPFTVGSRVEYTYSVTNTGNVALHDLTVQDDRVTGITCQATTLAPGQSTTCTGTHTVTQADLDRCRQAGTTPCTITNTASATAEDPNDIRVVSEPDTETIVVNVVPRPSLSVEKVVASTGPFTVGSQVVYSYRVTNTGNVPLHSVAVNDNKVANVTCQAVSLAPGESTDCTGDYTVTQADLDRCRQTGTNPCTITNTATATGTDPEGTEATSPPDSETITVNEQPRPHLTIRKEAESPGPFPVGSRVRYTYTATNTGNVPLHDLTVQDDKVTGITCQATTLAPGQSTTCTGTYTVTQADLDRCRQTGTNPCTITNTATDSGRDPNGNL